MLSESGRGLFVVSQIAYDFSVSGRLGGGSHARAVLPFQPSRQELMNDLHVCRFGEADEADLPEDIAAIYAKNRERVGFVPNVFKTYARRPEHFRAFVQYHDVLMKGESGLSRAEREAIVVVVSAENACQYCVTAHGAAFRIHRQRFNSPRIKSPSTGARPS